jgi:hypothetical protein
MPSPIEVSPFCSLTCACYRCVRVSSDELILVAASSRGGKQKGPVRAEERRPGRVAESSCRLGGDARVAMVQAVHFWNGNHSAAQCRGPRHGCVLLEAQVRSCAHVVTGWRRAIQPKAADVRRRPSSSPMRRVGASTSRGRPSCSATSPRSRTGHGRRSSAIRRAIPAAASPVPLGPVEDFGCTRCHSCEAPSIRGDNTLAYGHATCAAGTRRVDQGGATADSLQRVASRTRVCSRVMV